MAKINLLPWRSERRKLRQKEFVSMLGLAAGAALALSVMIVMYFSGQIQGQEERNRYLESEIKKVEARIAEIDELDKKKRNLLARKEVIEQLQASRSQMVHLFDELVRTIPEGVRLNSIQQQGQVLTLEGFAQSNARVSSYMRNLEASGWITSPDLKIIEAKGDDKGLPNMFSLRVTLRNPNSSQEELDAAALDAQAQAAAGGGK